MIHPTMHKTRELLLRHSRQMALAAAREPLTNARAALLKLATEQLVVADELYPEVGPGAVGDDPFAPATPKNGQPPAPAPA